MEKRYAAIKEEILDLFGAINIEELVGSEDVKKIIAEIGNILPSLPVAQN